MLEILPQFMSAPTSFQFAKDGLWENAWSFPNGRLPSQTELLAYLAQTSEVAFEAFFGQSFFGARITGTALEVQALSIKCLHAARAGPSFFTVFGQALGCPVAGQRPAFAEIGCVDAWRSVGAVRIAEPQLALSDFARLWHSVLGSSVSRNTRHAKAIEFAFEHPLAHWFAVPVSAASDTNLISEKLLREALALVALPTPQASQNAP
jgi:hypothetical protein